ncbi:MAG: stage III sporulation protein AA [Roseburia sp.]|nr:stage III sporulation protein AA [Roseburia sp.]
MRNQLLQFFPERLRDAWARSGLEIGDVQEIRLRVNQPVRVLAGQERELPIKYDARDMEDIFRYLCHDSVYAYEEERKQGYLMADGGHRIGITGELTALGQGMYIAKYIRYMNIRIAHEQKNIADNIICYLYDREGTWPLNTLIVSPPGVGKTTLLRDMIRLLSNGTGGYAGCNVGVVDERGEIAGAYRGSALLDCGRRTDVITGGDKQQGISILVRTFAPRVIAIDEIGGKRDAQAIFRAGVSGCSILATAHGNSLKDIEGKAELSELMREELFERFILLSSRNDNRRYARILDGKGNELCGEKLLRACV